MKVAEQRWSELKGSWRLEPVVGIEPTTYGLRNRCSTTELHWLNGILPVANPALAILEECKFMASQFATRATPTNRLGMIGERVLKMGGAGDPPAPVGDP